MHESSEQSTVYQSFLLRLWREHANQSWHVALLNIQSGEAKRFADLEQLITFLDAIENQRQADQTQARNDSQ